MASALPLPRFRAEDTQSLTRWLTFQAPDLVVQVGADAVQLEGVRVERIAVAGATAALQKLLSADIAASGGAQRRSSRESGAIRSTSPACSRNVIPRRRRSVTSPPYRG